MKKAVMFDEFAACCPFFNSETEVNNGYGCNHPKQEETEEENGKQQGCCFCHKCPLGIEAEQEDLTDPEHEDAIKDEIDWDGCCDDGYVSEGEILLVNIDKDASKEEKDALYHYERYMHRYDKAWLDAHGIANSLVS